MARKFFFALLGLALIGFIAGGSWWRSRKDAYPVRPDQVFTFEGVRGPTEKTVMPKALPTDWTKYESGAANCFAVLLTETNSCWLGLAHGLKSIGIPFRITRDYQAALRHEVVLVYPVVSGSAMARDALRAIAAHPRNGGTLLAVNVLGGGLEEVFGFAEVRPSRKDIEVRFDTGYALTSAFTEPQERVVRIANRARSQSAIGTHGYTAARPPPLAIYDDGAAAITQRSYATGRAFAFGIDLGHLLLRGYDQREEGAARGYVNEFEPALDVFLRLLKSIYVNGESNAVTLGTVPFNRSLTVLLTHDIDYTRSISNALTYAVFEKSAGIQATYFLQTKYIRDFNDDSFFCENNLHFVRELAALGMELGSHSVAHANAFKNFSLGSGQERYPDYKPFVVDRQTAYNGTILGELRVSKFLIERFSPGLNVVAFRPGHLSNPFQLPQALAATGYRFSSSVTANNSLTHLPFELNRDREQFTETGIFEFPITVEDERPPRMGERLPQALALARKIARYGGCCVVLIHPDVLDHKLEFERGFVAALKDSAWFGTVSEFGEWWSARNEIQVAVRPRGRELEVTLEIPKRIRGLTLETPAAWRYYTSEPGTLQVSQSGAKVAIQEAVGQVRLVFVK